MCIAASENTEVSDDLMIPWRAFCSFSTVPGQPSTEKMLDETNDTLEYYEFEVRQYFMILPPRFTLFIYSLIDIFVGLLFHNFQDSSKSKLAKGSEGENMLMYSPKDKMADVST